MPVDQFKKKLLPYLDTKQSKKFHKTNFFKISFVHLIATFVLKSH